MAQLSSVTQVHTCIDTLLQAGSFGAEVQESLQKAKRLAEGSREACSATEQKATMLGCRDLSDLVYQFLAEGVAVLLQCRQSLDGCSSRGMEASELMRSVWVNMETSHRHLPSASLVSNKLTELAGEVLGTFLQGGVAGFQVRDNENELPLPWRVAVLAADRIHKWLQGYIWRETHWIWLQDSLHAGQVVHTTWGPPEEWNEKFGVHDCDSPSPLSAGGPRYVFSDLSGMRWEVMAALLRDLHHSRGSREPLVVVELGVFAGMLAYHLLKDLDFIVHIGVDPYIGSDGTFPGNFSDSLDPDIAMYKAMSVMKPYGERAHLVPLSSEEAAKEVQSEVDAIFVDGCHLYDCVRQDLDLWLPKLRRGVETLVSGHDFSPQWPGVVRAVHERRAGGGQVNLASDWVFWWHEHLQ